LANHPRFSGCVFRKDLIPLLLDNSLSVSQIARLVGEVPRDIEADLRHLLKSLQHTGFTAVIEPARCRKCGFEFDAAKLAKPSKCPQCRSTWILEPRIRLNESAR
jgi:predicted Zn-ribbon and HTH transcriptional regulator